MSAALSVNTMQSLEHNFYCLPDSSLPSCLFSCLISEGKKNGLLWVLPLYSLSEGKKPSVSSCHIYIWNTQPYLSLANSSFSARSFCLKQFVFSPSERSPLPASSLSTSFISLSAARGTGTNAEFVLSSWSFSILQMLFLPFEVHVQCSHLRVVVSASTQRLPSIPQLFLFWMCFLFLAAILYSTSLWVSASL